MAVTALSESCLSLLPLSVRAISRGDASSGRTHSLPSPYDGRRPRTAPVGGVSTLAGATAATLVAGAATGGATRGATRGGDCGTNCDAIAVRRDAGRAAR